MSRFLETFSDTQTDRPAFWFMRQAGRYLPEYRELRAQMGGFLDLCYAPEEACEVTLQPLRRFDMDAAIIFSDILVIPQAMGSDLSFVKGEGPRLSVTTTGESIDSLKMETKTFLTPVYDALKLTRSKLEKDKALIGFAGAPWTLACYMLQGRGGNGFKESVAILEQDPKMVEVLIEKLTGCVADHLIAQIEAGADAVQLFDSWAGLCPEQFREMCVFNPAQKIAEKIKSAKPNTPFIAFPRGCGTLLSDYAKTVKPDGISIDTETPLESAKEQIPESVVIQGNIDPQLLAHDKSAVCDQVRRALDIMQGRRYIVNLGHGIIPETPIENVAAVSDIIKEAA